MLSGTEKRLIQIFKIFVEKAFVPQIKKFDGSLVQWNKFSSMLMTDNLNFSELQVFVDSIQGIPNGDKQPHFSRRSEAESNDVSAFNPNKTFGGERNKPNLFPMQDNEHPDTRRDSQRDESLRQRVVQNGNNIFMNLEKLLKTLEENQVIIDNPQNRDSRESRESISKQPVIPANRNSVQYNGSNTPIGVQSYNFLPQTHPHSFGPQVQSQPQLQSAHNSSLGYYKNYY